MPHMQPSQYRNSQSYLDSTLSGTPKSHFTMCSTLRILYACTYDARLAENGCKSYNTRKELLRDSQTDEQHPPPIIAYCPEGRKRVEEGAPACEPSESCYAQDEITCPLKCPTCWEVFLDRLTFSIEEANAMRSKLADTHKNMEEMELEAEASWVTIDMENLLSDCKADKESFEADLDGVLLSYGEAIRENDDNSLAKARLQELPGRRLDYDGYEARKKEIVDRLWK